MNDSLVSHGNMKPDTHYRLPSGAVVNLINLDTSLCRDGYDCDDLVLAIKEKIVDLEYQIECVDLGLHPDGVPFTAERPLDRHWLARLKKALAWSKLQLADASMRKQHLSRGRKDDKSVTIQHLFVSTAKLILEPQVFEQIMSISRQLAQSKEDAT